MYDFKGLELSVLYDHLAATTAKYTHMLTNGVTDDEFDLCKQKILQLQSEIEARKISQIVGGPDNDELPLAIG